eukprot:TRINITY_DN10600_c0_g1_i1.p1 TRINITY_DN10600_c0_g1~~TRINITY_DN10600_c0_g1_i1.p1  ORF type:complete len:360 (-),score=77.04 TRINITY_DN10600_c0_g1_i1:134-1213(-)
MYKRLVVKYVLYEMCFCCCFLPLILSGIICLLPDVCPAIGMDGGWVLLITGIFVGMMLTFLALILAIHKTQATDQHDNGTDAEEGYIAMQEMSEGKSKRPADKPPLASAGKEEKERFNLAMYVFVFLFALVHHFLLDFYLVKMFSFMYLLFLLGDFLQLAVLVRLYSAPDSLDQRLLVGVIYSLLVVAKGSPLFFEIPNLKTTEFFGRNSLLLLLQSTVVFFIVLHVYCSKGKAAHLRSLMLHLVDAFTFWGDAATVDVYPLHFRRLQLALSWIILVLVPVYTAAVPHHSAFHVMLEAGLGAVIVDVPMIASRIVKWGYYSQPIPAFAFKNGFSLFVAAVRILDYFREEYVEAQPMVDR